MKIMHIINGKSPREDAILYDKGTAPKAKNWPTIEKGTTVKPVLSGRSKIIPKLVFKMDYRLMQVKRERAFCNTFDLH